MKTPFTTSLLLSISIGLFPAIAQAHAGIGSTNGFLAGLLHPVSGLDHCCAMVAVGLWASQLGNRAVWAVPLAFVGAMIAGSLAGMAGMTIPLVEQGIALSVLLLGLLIAAAAKLPLPVSMAIVAAFALIHGHAHGAEMPETAAGLSYGVGFALATLGLHGLGILGATSLKRTSRPYFVRCTGAAIAMNGSYLWLT